MKIQDLSSARTARLRRLVKAKGLDGYLTVSAVEQRYLSGIELSAGEAVFLITPQKAYCITKELIVPKMAAARAFLKTEAVPFGTMLAGAVEKAAKLGLRRVAFDPEFVDLAAGEILLKAKFERQEGFVSQLRMGKDKDEVAKLRKACQIAWESFHEVKPKIKTGMTEEEVRILMAVAMHKRGADSVPFNIVCFGENTADAHHTPSKTRKLKKSEAVLMDFGCFYEGYTSDMTRSWWHGPATPTEYQQIWNLVDKAHRAGVKTLRPGVTAGAVDKAARDIIAAAGYGKEFFHTTGHGIGLVVHDAPILRSGSKAVLPENAVVTVEPGIYFAGKWGIRLEDSFLVTKKGAKKLTQK